MFALPLFFCVRRYSYPIATPTDDGDYLESEDPDYKNMPEVANNEGKS